MQDDSAGPDVQSITCGEHNDTMSMSASLSLHLPQAPSDSVSLSHQYIQAGSPNESELYKSDGVDVDIDNYPASFTESIRGHVMEGGLRYHAYHDGQYAFPNDEVEQNREDMKHTMTTMLCNGRYHYAPIEDAMAKGGRVLDLGQSINSLRVIAPFSHDLTKFNAKTNPPKPTYLYM
jgi:hypothetical protein